MAEHDESYKLIFSHPEMVKDLLVDFIRQQWMEGVDFSTLEPVRASFISDDLREREDDIIWRVRRRDEWLYIYLLLEFQSTVDPFMAVRLMVYIGLLYQDLIRNNELTKNRKLPPVFPMVLYNGEGKWTAALDVAELIEPVEADLDVYLPHLRYHLIAENEYSQESLSSLSSDGVTALFQLENSRTFEEVQRGLENLIEWLKEPTREPLARALMVWLQRVLLPRKAPGIVMSEVQSVQEAGAMLAERVKKWDAGDFEDMKEYIKEQAIKETEDRVRKETEDRVRKETEDRVRKETEDRVRKETGLLLENASQQAQAALLTRQLEQKFGPLPEADRIRIANADSEVLMEWGGSLLTATRLQDVFA